MAIGVPSTSSLSLSAIVSTHCLPSALMARSKSFLGISYRTPPNESASDEKGVLQGMMYEPGMAVEGVDEGIWA